MNNIAPQSPVMRRLTLQDNPAIARVIRQVSAEYGLTADKGYTVADPNLDELYQVYSQPGHAYWVVEYEGEVVGGGGIAPLAGSESDICELQKMYFLEEGRGKGIGFQLIQQCLEKATGFGYEKCYLETMPFMLDAQKLYKKVGFENICSPMGSTGHTSCPVWMLKDLAP